VSQYQKGKTNLDITEARDSEWQWQQLGHVHACTSLQITAAVLAMKPEATAIGDLQDGRWKITLTFDGRRFCIPKFRTSTLQQTTRQ